MGVGGGTCVLFAEVRLLYRIFLWQVIILRILVKKRVGKTTPINLRAERLSASF